ncbi:MAG: ATP-grasp domain-containing protein [Terriglobales bacterium]
MKEIDALVTGAETRQGLAVIRGLGWKGVSVCAAGAEADSMGFYSRYATARCHYPSAMEDKRGFVDAILAAVREHRIRVVLPAVESTVIALDEFREEVESVCRVALAPRPALHAALDKKETLALAARVGIPIPRSFYPADMKEAEDFAKSVGYPVVMKPRAMASFGKGGGPKFKVAYAHDRAELARQLDTLCPGGLYPILQEYCPGVRTCMGVFFVEGEMLGIYQYKGIRELPLTGGVTTLHVSVPIDPDLRKWTQSLVTAMGYSGVANSEFRVDEATGRKVLMEINPRFYGPQSGSNLLGLNFPYAAYRYTLEGHKEPMPVEYPIGVRNRYLRGDVSALWQLWQREAVDYLAPLPGRGRALLDVLSGFSPSVQSDVMDWGDPWPGVREGLALIRQYGREMAGYYLRKMWSA